MKTILARCLSLLPEGTPATLFGSVTNHQLGSDGQWSESLHFCSGQLNIDLLARSETELHERILETYATIQFDRAAQSMKMNDL